MRLSRPCFDKYHRCPGWAGGGMRRAEVVRCNGGRIDVSNGARWKWRFHRCDTCNVIVLPYRARWLFPSVLAWEIRNIIRKKGS